MRAKEEYDKWCALERMHEESRYGDMQQKAYIAGFRRAIELIEQSLKGEVYERTPSMAQVQNGRDSRTPQESVPLCRG
jgi:hypothetical protein